MLRAQHTNACKIYLHPTTCTRPCFIDDFQRRTGMQVITTPHGLAVATPQNGGRP